MIKTLIMTLVLALKGCTNGSQTTTINTSEMKATEQTADNSKKRILARGCSPELSLRFSKVVPPLVGNAVYIPVTDDVEFVKKLKSEKWSVVYFAPGACRYDAAKMQIPGGNSETAGWSLDQYKKLIYKLQGDDIQIVESIYEEGAIEMLNNALANAREIK